MSYWDINQFLAEEERIEFCFKLDAYFMDFLDSTKEGIINEGQTINTPIWLVNTIYDYLEMPSTSPFIETHSPSSSRSPSPKIFTLNRWIASIPSEAVIDPPSKRSASNQKCHFSTKSTTPSKRSLNTTKAPSSKGTKLLIF